MAVGISSRPVCFVNACEWAAGGVQQLSCLGTSLTGLPDMVYTLRLFSGLFPHLTPGGW
jgi:hypothetical protein